jgi:hypothetical protein
MSGAPDRTHASAAWRAYGAGTGKITPAGPCLGVLRSGCGCQFAGDASCPVIDLRPVAEVASGKSRTSGRELAKRPLGEGQFPGVQGTEEDVVTARVQCLGELGNLLQLRRTNSVASLRQCNSYAALPITKAS